MHALACRERWALPSSGFTVAHDCSEYHLIVHVAPRCSCGGFASVTQMCRQRSATLEPCCVVKLHVDAKLKQGVCMHGIVLHVHRGVTSTSTPSMHRLPAGTRASARCLQC
jgi:hypothetical protein